MGSESPQGCEVVAELQPWTCWTHTPKMYLVLGTPPSQDLHPHVPVSLTGALYSISSILWLSGSATMQPRSEGCVLVCPPHLKFTSGLAAPGPPG